MVCDSFEIIIHTHTHIYIYMQSQKFWYKNKKFNYNTCKIDTTNEQLEIILNCKKSTIHNKNLT